MPIEPPQWEKRVQELERQADVLIEKAAGTPGPVGKRELYEAANAALDAAWVARRGKRA
jgi:hypothetical protein